MDIKPQDIVFLAVFIVLLFSRNPKFFAIAGLISIAISIPLFQKWIFFTAQRLTWYSAAFFLASVLLNLIAIRHNK
jgi:hypothetical protein